MTTKTDSFSQKSIRPFKRERLPHELFYGWIIPYLFSAYLHEIIVYDKKHEWNPFTQLPLISKDFRRSCRILVYRIFDVSFDEADATKTVRKLLLSTRNLWREARKLPLFERPHKLAVPSTYGNLMSSQSLIQIYICAGYAKYYYTMDVLNPLSLDRLWITRWMEGSEQNQHRGDPHIGMPEDFLFRPFKMADDRVHRVFLPFTCAMKLCDLIQPDGLVDHIADYLAHKAVTYGTEPILLKHVQDLEMNMARKYELPLCMWSKWTKDTLRLIDERHTFLRAVQGSGVLVKKYGRPSELSWQTIRNTRILDILRVVSLVDWGTDTEDIREYANYIFAKLFAIYKYRVTQPEQNDEYFVQEDRRIFFSQIVRIPIPS